MRTVYEYWAEYRDNVYRHDPNVVKALGTTHGAIELMTRQAYYAGVTAAMSLLGKSGSPDNAAKMVQNILKEVRKFVETKGNDR